METMTVKDALIETKKMLENIQVPMSMIEQIGIPLARGISNISQCIEAMNKAEAEKEQES